MNFGPALKTWRENQRLSPESIAQGANITIEELNNIENGEAPPDKKVVQALCEALGIPPTYMVMLSLNEADIPEQRGKTIFGQLQGPIKDMLLELSRPNGLELVIRERKEHFKKHNRTVEQDVLNNPNGELKQAAIYAITDDAEEYPGEWDIAWAKKMEQKDEIGRLVVAASLLIAEIDRLLELERREKEAKNQQPAETP